MSASTDRLYELLPAFHRSADAAQGFPLRALLRVIDEQVGVVEADLAQLHDDAFIETCADWVVPYIGDLVGYRPVREAGDPGDPASAQGRLRNSFLIPRREVANTIAMRRRKGTLSALETLIDDVGAWPGFAVEFQRRLGWTQHLDHLHIDRGRTLDLRDTAALDRLGGAFDRSARTVDVRRIVSHHRRGRSNIPDIGAFVFRMRAYSVTGTPACCLEQVGPQCYTFSVLGNDVPLYTRPQAGVVPPTELSLPLPIRRRAFEYRDSRHPPVAHASTDIYGSDASLAIHAPDWPTKGAAQPIPATSIVPADLRDWSYAPPRNHVAVDPATGRILFPAKQLPKGGVSVDYRYGFSADIGGGEYARTLLQPTLADIAHIGVHDLRDVPGLLVQLQQTGDPLAAWLRGKFSPSTLQSIDAHPATEEPSDALVAAVASALDGVLDAADLFDSTRFGSATRALPADLAALVASAPAGAMLMRMNRQLLEFAYPDSVAMAFGIWRVGKGALSTLREALRLFDAAAPRYGVIEFVDSGVWSEPVSIHLAARQTLQLRAAEGTRPVLRMLDYMSDRPDAFTISGDAGSRFVLDGVMLAGRGLQINGAARAGAGSDGDLCEVLIRHCTLVPGWSLDCDCEPKRPAEPGIEMIGTRASLAIEHSIVGSIEVGADATRADPVDIRISDSVVDATRSGSVALSAMAEQYAYARVSVVRSTVLGTLRTHAIGLAENSLFMGCVHVARSQQGCMRFCYVTPASRTPKRYHCQPDLVCAAALSDPTLGTVEERTAARHTASLRVRPAFDSTRYGHSAYCRLALDGPVEIARGADDASEMGVFHDLFQPQRIISLQTRLGEYTPAGSDAGILFGS